MKIQIIGKLILLAGLTFFSTLKTYAQSGVTPTAFMLAGTISGREKGIVVLEYVDVANLWVKDTAQVVNGKFMFKGAIMGPTRAYLVGNIKSIDLDDPNRKLLFLEPTAMTVELSEGDFRHGLVTGSRTQQELDEYNAEIHPQRTAMAAIRKRWPKPGAVDSRSQKLRDQDEKDIDSIAKEKCKIQYKFVADHPHSFLCPFLMLSYRDDGITEDSARKLYNRFSLEVKNSRLGMAVFKEMTARASTQSGDIAPTFVRKDSRGRLVRLSSFNGKSYVLLDFWASWCHACRDLSPHLRDLYKTYHPEGLEIISISADINTDKWRKAIAKDSTGIWTHIGGYLNESVKGNLEADYAVTALPVLVLIDKQGKIVERYAGGEDHSMEDLDSKLRELLGK
jgi:thiol-disulfide isomerase/thioredoxin